MKIFDCFMYFNEEMVVDVRLNTLNDFVDYFVIVESKFTHKGEPRELRFNHKKFERFKDKIIYLIFDKEPAEIETVRSDDTEEEKAFFGEMFHDLLQLFTRPLTQDTFDFSDQHFFNEIANLGEQFAKNTTLRKMNGNRGSKHFIYVNRTFFGLYNLTHEIGAKSVTIQNVAFT